MAGAIFADWPLFIRVLRHRIFSNYQKIFIANTIKDIYLRLDDVSPDNLDHLRFVGNSIRNYLTGITLPTEVEEAVVKTWQGLGENLHTLFSPQRPPKIYHMPLSLVIYHP